MLKKDKLIEDVENIYFKEFYIQRNKNNHILFYQSFGELRSKKITQEEFEKAKNGEIDLSYFKKKYCLLWNEFINKIKLIKNEKSNILLLIIISTYEGNTYHQDAGALRTGMDEAALAQIKIK